MLLWFKNRTLYRLLSLICKIAGIFEIQFHKIRIYTDGMYNKDTEPAIQSEKKKHFVYIERHKLRIGT
jgi:hypothetical protein